MNILFVHQNFPGQFRHLAPALAGRGHRVVALTDSSNAQATEVTTFRYRHDATRPEAAATRLGRTFTEMTDRATTVARAAAQLAGRHAFVPDVVFGHLGWGETLFLREVFPAARHLVYAEFYYGARGRDSDFDPEFQRPGLARAMSVTARKAHLALAMAEADAALAPTRWQASTFPHEFAAKTTVCFDGVDTDRVRPDPAARFTLPTGQVLAPGDEVLTFVNRNFGPYRGFHVFMRALPAVLAARPEAQVVLVGGDGSSYESPPAGGGSWRERMLAELGDRLDLSRIHFVGRLAYDRYLALLQVGRVHAYLTYPFVLSWSMIEAMAAGCCLVASRTPPVEEFLTDGVTGRLVDFFDVAGWSHALIAALADPGAAAPLRLAARAHAVARCDLARVCLPRLLGFVESGGRQSDRAAAAGAGRG
ncbi:MAG: glycosyltransferase [Rhodobacteraceae bacterium]|nr:glycosyltransferase [Paracoccaceae bacterium]